MFEKQQPAVRHEALFNTTLCSLLEPCREEGGECPVSHVEKTLPRTDAKLHHSAGAIPRRSDASAEEHLASEGECGGWVSVGGG